MTLPEQPVLSLMVPFWCPGCRSVTGNEHMRTTTDAPYATVFCATCQTIKLSPGQMKRLHQRQPGDFGREYRGSSGPWGGP